MSTLSSPDQLSSSVKSQLTPRSKVQALISTIDGDSDEDASPIRPYGRRVPLQPLDVNRNTARALNPEEISNWKPSKILAGNQQSPATLDRSTISTFDVNDGSESLSDVDDGKGAYQRIKAQMLSKKPEATSPQPPTKRSGDDELLSEDEDDEVVPRGRMAARLQSKIVKTNGVLSDRTEQDLHDMIAPDDAGSRTYGNTHIRSPSPTHVAPLKRKRLQLRKKTQQDFVDQSPGSASEKTGEDREIATPVAEAPNARFAALVAKKREERATREAEDDERRRQRLERLAEEIANVEKDRLPKKKGKTAKRQTHSEDSEDDDPLSSQILTQNSRPTRKASKKALEEMSKETQRISRNMQLAHEARTKKKITKESLLQRFNFRVATPDTVIAPATSSSAPATDGEDERSHQTPPTSPVSPPEAKLSTIETNTAERQTPVNQEIHLHHVEVACDEVPLLVQNEDHQNAEQKMALRAVHSPSNAAKTLKGAETISQARPWTLPRPFAKATALKDHMHSGSGDASSDSDLEIVPRERSALLATFERIQPLSRRGAEGKAMKTLRTLAHITSPGNKQKAGLTPAMLQASLKKKARLQAAQERAEKIQDLRDRGVIIRTDEERQKDQAEFEDMLEKARQENEELAKKEKIEARQEAKANGEELQTSDEEDDEYNGEANDGEDQDDLEFSGSEDESEEVEDEDEDGENPRNEQTLEGFLDDQAVDASEEEEEEEEEDFKEALQHNSDQEAIGSESELVFPSRKARRTTRIIDDEDDEEDEEITAVLTAQEENTSKNPFGALNSTQARTSGSPAGGPFGVVEAPMGLTQAFAATMADSQDVGSPIEEQDSLAQLEPMPDPDFLGVDADTVPVMTQQESGLQLDLHLSQSQVQYETIPVPELTQSDLPEPTQDMGFGMSSPVGGRFTNAPPSTIDTLPVSVSPIAQRKGRLRRGTKHVVSDEEDMADDEEESDAEYTENADAFSEMKRAAKLHSRAKMQELFDKKKSEAKEMVEEQAQESEDEYAGIGGASDDESGSEMDEAVKQMIDEGKVDVNERELAAFHANKERMADEKAVEKLFKDINNGGLRRKRHAEFDLSDSDDDIEDRRRRKRAEFARMRKALLADEKVGKIAEDPKKLAFLRAIEDREEGEYEELIEEQLLENGDAEDGEQQQIPDSQAEKPLAPVAPVEESVQAGTKRKRPLAPISSNTRRRAHLPSKPLTLSEIRASVSFLTEDPREFTAAPHLESDGGSDADVEERTAVTSTYARRVTTTTVVDRIALRRDESMNSTTSALGRMAYQTSDAAAAPGFRVPSLLRRATTGLSNMSDTSSASGRASDGSYGSRGHVSTSTTRSNSVNGATSLTAETIKKGGTSKKSSVNFVAREAVRRTQIDGVEQRRREGILKRKREASSGLGRMLGSGKWE